MFIKQIQHVKQILIVSFWLGLANIPLAMYLGCSYCPPVDFSPWYAVATYFAAATGHFFLYFTIFSCILIAPFIVFKGGFKKVSIIYATLILAILHIVLATDAQVYGLYRFHVNATVLDLFFNGGDEVISLSLETWLYIIGKVIFCFIYSACAATFAIWCYFKGFKSRILVTLALSIYLAANIINAYAAAAFIYPIIEIKYRLPLYKPFSMNKLLKKIGVVPEINIYNKAMFDSSIDGNPDYPKHALTYDNNKISAPYNVLLLVVDTLRYDMLTQEDMPNTWEFSKNAWVYNNYYSSANLTAGGIFGLFYGIPATYWHIALETNFTPVINKVISDSSYKYGIFASAHLQKPEFDHSVFFNIPNLRSKSKGDTPWERDLDVINDFKDFLGNLKPNEKFFSFVFLDAVHGYSYPESFKEIHSPAKPLNYMQLSRDADRTPYFNRYRNAVTYTDSNMKTIYDLLKEHGYHDNTIVIITADHGESLNEDRDGFWGHTSSFREYQLKVPFIMKWPGMGAKQIDTKAVAYDVTATLLPRVFGVQNPTKDYSIGQDLLSLKERPFLYVCGYSESAILENDRIVIVDKSGWINIKDKLYRPSKDTSNSKYLLESMDYSNYYLKK